MIVYKEFTKNKKINSIITAAVFLTLALAGTASANFTFDDIDF